MLPLGSEAQLPVIRFVRDPDPAPDFQVKDLDGKDVSLAAHKGQVILLNFWATWCGPCRAEIPGLVELQSKYKDQLQIIGMVVDEDEEDNLRDIVKSERINYPVALTSPEVRMAYGGIAALPTVFVINPEGRVVQKHVGLFNPALYETEVRALLNLPVAAQIETFNDTGEIFLKHADRATMLPGVNTEGLTPQQRAVVLHKFNAENCTCGCQFTLAQCRIYDPACKISMDRCAAIVKEVAESKPTAKPESAPAPAVAPASAPATAPQTPSATPPSQPSGPPATDH
ncbi:MAG TPA: TlpA disulfide reductase family protein [Candidatus Sulfotelmatobacter sp.]|nr:TlpA disulfide reductase family protein [Candidatus Sulfotelmatobacter sp.]